jgi:hypothetical protein
MKKSTFMIIITILTIGIIGFGLHLMNNVCEYGGLTRPSIENSYKE